MRLAVLGARQQRRGIGGHLARFAAGAGANVVAVLGTTPASAAEAADGLGKALGRRPRPYCEFEELLASEALDALIVATPPATHAPFLLRAAQEGLHVLCEKPVCWGGMAPETEARVIAERFEAQGLHLRAVCQWPFTLPVYEALHGPIGQPTRFRMQLGPSSTGREMLVDALSHPLSLLHAVVDDSAAQVQEIEVQALDAHAAEITFQYSAGSRRIDCRVDLHYSPDPPRPAGYGFDGHWVQREIELPLYAMRLVSGDREIPLPDPTPLLVRSFFEGLGAGVPPTVDPALVPGVAQLAALVASWPAELHTPA